jgi:hypothetical protein
MNDISQHVCILCHKGLETKEAIFNKIIAHVLICAFQI